MKQYRIHMTRKEVEDLYTSLSDVLHKYGGDHKNNVMSIKQSFSDAYNNDYNQEDFMFICTHSEVKTIQVAIMNNDKGGRLTLLEV